MENRCVCCGAVIPEGRQVCQLCWDGAHKRSTAAESPTYMNAVEARKLMKDSIKKYIEKRVRLACADGKFSTVVRFVNNMSTKVIDEAVCVFESLGYKVHWDEEGNKITLDWSEE